MILSSLLSSSSFIMTNKILIKAVGTDAAILYWVTERLRELEKKDANYKEFKKKKVKEPKIETNFKQREYPPDFFNFLYCN